MPSKETAETARFVLFPIEDAWSWRAYKDIALDFWVVENYTKTFDARRLGHYALLPTVIRWMEVSVHGGFLGRLCAAAQTAEARMFYGTHVMRFNLRLEAFSYLAAQISSANEERLVALEDADGANDAAQHRSNFLLHIVEKLPPTPLTEDHAALALIVHVIFAIGSLAVLNAVREDVGDSVPFLEIIDPIVADVRSLMQYLVYGYKFNPDTHSQWVRAALDIERDMIRTHVPERMRPNAMLFFDVVANPVLLEF